jgi:hypothetical protein
MDSHIIEATQQETGEFFRFRFTDHGVALNAMASLKEHGLGAFLETYGAYEDFE